MGEDQLRGKSFEAMAKDIAEGYVFVNPIFLKKFEQETIKGLLSAITKIMTLVRNDRFPTGDIEAIKRRNMRLSRLNNANTVIRHFAKERRWII